MNCDDQRERALCEARGEPIPEWVTKIQNEKLAQEEAKDEASPSSNRDSALPNKDERKKIDYSKPVFGAPVQICEQCMNRERKRAGRKKNKKPEEEEKWLQDEALRIIVFNTSQVRKWEPFPAGTGPPNAPGAVYAETQMRICCYCRHHGEKEGFRVIFTIKDHNGNVVAQTLSSTIVITDDHKNAATSSQVSPGAFTQDGALTANQHVPMSPTHLNTGGFVQPNFMGVSPMQEPPSYSQGFGVNGQTNGHTNGHAGSLAGSPSPQMRHSMSPGGHQAKRRKGSKVSANLTMTPAEAPPQYHQQQQYTHPNMSMQQMRATPEQQLWQNGPIQPAPGHPGKTIPMTGMHGPAPPTNGLHTGGFPTSPMPQQSDNSFFSTNGWHVGGPANNGVGQMVNHMPTSPIMYNNQQMKTIPASLPESPRTTLPRISRVIPHEGPVRGGIDCTLLGHYFVPGLTALFGDIPSTETTFFSESVLICRLPATATPGDVTVSIRGVVESSRTRNPIFTYVDDVDKELMALALTVVGLKMKGKGQEMNTSKQIALQILTDNGLGKDFMPSGGRAGDMSHADLEVTLLKVLDFIDMDDSPHPASLGQRNKSGQSMLHLACMLGMQKFVAALLARGVNVNSRDRNGYTPLHFAALHKKSDVVRRLLMNRADPGIRTKGNETAADLGESDVIVSATRTAQRQVHSRQHSRSSSISEGSGYTRSRSGSVASLRALAPVMTRGSVDDYYDNGSEEDSSDEDEDSEDQNWPSRRGSSHEMAPVVKTVISDQMAEAATQAITPINAAAAAPYMAAWMDNWHERFFQGFQGWPGLQLNMPAIPGITTADYQTAILNQMAKLGNPMAKSKAVEAAEESQTVNQEGSDYKWSELFSPPAPPAYNALYPDGNELGNEAPEKILPVEPVQTTASTSALSRSASPSTGLREIHRKIARGDIALTEAQRAEYRSHVAKMKRIQNDRRLYFFWIPTLIFITVLVAFNQGAGIWSCIKQVLGFVWTVLTDPLAVRTSVISGVQRVLATPPAPIPTVVPAA
ncbi:hypothetical protein BZA77DRAFT_242454 [Pyronema omphalodes]|nr:hypothetical protein BZA77DRAFT_242454 [Pyronema omphalodes]